MSRARATLNSASASLKKTRRSAEVGAFDVGRPPSFLRGFTGNQAFHSVSILRVRKQAVGGPGPWPGETGPTAARFFISPQDLVYGPCPPQAFGWRDFCRLYFRANAGTLRVEEETTRAVLAALRFMVLLSAFGESEICFGS